MTFICAWVLFQSKAIAQFASVLADHCSRRQKGVDAKGSTRGCHNARLIEAMKDVRTASDLTSIKMSKTSSIAIEVELALKRLKQHQLIPCTVSGECVKAAYQALQYAAPYLSNQELFKFLWGRA